MHDEEAHDRAVKRHIEAAERVVMRKRQKVGRRPGELVLAWWNSQGVSQYKIDGVRQCMPEVDMVNFGEATGAQGVPADYCGAQELYYYTEPSKGDTRAGRVATLLRPRVAALFAGTDTIRGTGRLSWTILEGGVDGRQIKRAKGLLPSVTPPQPGGRRCGDLVTPGIRT